MLGATINLYKNSYGGLSRNTWLLSLVMLVNRSGTMVVPFMTMYMTQHIGVSISKAGFVMSLFGAGAVVGFALFAPGAARAAGGFALAHAGRAGDEPVVCSRRREGVVSARDQRR